MRESACAYKPVSTCVCMHAYAYILLYTCIHLYQTQGLVHRPARRHYTHGQTLFRARAQFGPGGCPVPGGGAG